MKRRRPRVPSTMRWLVVFVAACSSTSPPARTAPAPPVAHPTAPAALVAAAHARWLGDPARAVVLLRDASDADGLAELGRAQLALGDLAAADRTFARAVAIAEDAAGTRGAWRWGDPVRARLWFAEFTADGRWLVTADVDGRITVRDFVSQRVVRTLQTAQYPRTLAVSPNGRWIASGRERTQVWDLGTGTEVANLGYRGAITFTPDDHLAAAKRDAGFVIVDVVTRREIASFPGFNYDLLRAAGDRIIAVANDGAAIWGLATKRQLATFIVPGGIRDVRPLPSGELVVLGRAALGIYDRSGAPIRAIDGAYASLAASADRIVASTRSGRVFVFDRRGLHRATLATGDNTGVLAFHPLGDLLLAGGERGLEVWNARTAGHRGWFAKPAVAATALAFDAQGERLAVGSAVGHTAVWTLATGEVANRTMRPGDAVEHLAFGPGGELATASDDVLAVWDARGARRWWVELDRISRLEYRDGTLATVSAATPDDDAASQRSTWRSDGTLERRLPTASGIAAGALHPDGTTRAAAAGSDGMLGIWRGDEPVRALFDDLGAPAALAWTPDGKTLISAARDTASLWDPASGARLARLVGPDAIRALAVHPAGHVIATAHADGRVVLWALATAAPLATLYAPGELVAVVVTPDGAIDGTLPEDSVGWAVGERVLPGRGALARQRRANLLADRLAHAPRATSPQRGLAGAAAPSPPPICHPASTELPALRSSRVLPGGKHVRLCFATAPTSCFDVDLATGRYAPHAPSPREAIGAVTKPSVERDAAAGTVRVCHTGRCRDVRVREVTPEMQLAVDADAGLLAVAYKIRDAERDAVFVHDLATGRRLSQFIAVGAGSSYAFLGETLLATTTPCAGPCSSSTLFDARSGRRIGHVPINTSSLTPAHIDGEVWAFNDWESTTIVLQNVRTGRVAGRFELPREACAHDPDPGYLSCEGNTLLAAGANLVVLPAARAGDIVVVDRRGKLVANHELPRCQ